MKTQIATALAIASSAILPARATDASKTPAPVESQGTGGKEGGKFDPAKFFDDQTERK